MITIKFDDLLLKLLTWLMQRLGNLMFTLRTRKVVV